MSCIVRIIANQNVVKNRTGFDLYIMIVVSSDRIYDIWYNQGLWWGVFDQLWCLVPARLQSPHTAKVSERIGLGHPQTLQKIVQLMLDWACKIQFKVRYAVKLLSGEIHKTVMWQTVDMIYMTICKGHYYSTRQKIRYMSLTWIVNPWGLPLSFVVRILNFLRAEMHEYVNIWGIKC
jgi:hypothetical protein